MRNRRRTLRFGSTAISRTLRTDIKLYDYRINCLNAYGTSVSGSTARSQKVLPAAVGSVATSNCGTGQRTFLGRRRWRRNDHNDVVRSSLARQNWCPRCDPHRRYETQERSEKNGERDPPRESALVRPRPGRAARHTRYRSPRHSRSISLSSASGRCSTKLFQPASRAWRSRFLSENRSAARYSILRVMHSAGSRLP